MSKDRILIVDDDIISLQILENILYTKYVIYTKLNGNDTINFLKTNHVDLILLDLQLGDISGFEIIKYLSKNDIIKKTPVIIISSDSNAQSEELALSLGATDYIKKPFSPILVNKRIEIVLNEQKYKNYLENRIRLQKNQIDSMGESIIEALAGIIEYRSLETGEHTSRIRLYTEILLNTINELAFPTLMFSNDEIKIISHASTMHDIGKIHIPDNILLKPGPLTKEEFEIMKTHSIVGDQIINSFTDIYNETYCKYLHQICRHHHEKWNGTGYPDGLKGEEIPLAAQIVCLADVYDALTSQRIYKAAFSVDKTKEIILSEINKTFSPFIIDCFIQCEDYFRRIVLD